MNGWLRAAGTIGFALAVVGCGRGYELDTARVSGRVTLDGEPLSAGYVMVLPAKGRTARGSIQPDGTFVLGSYGKSDGAQLGEHPVVVAPIPVDEGSGPRKRGPKIPKRYRTASTSGLSLKVEPGGVDDWVIELTSAR